MLLTLINLIVNSSYNHFRMGDKVRMNLIQCIYLSNYITNIKETLGSHWHMKCDPTSTLIWKGVKNDVIKVSTISSISNVIIWKNIDIECIIDIWLLISVKFPFEWYAWKTYFDNFTHDVTYSITSFPILLIEITGKILILSVWLLCDYWPASQYTIKWTY